MFAGCVVTSEGTDAYGWIHTQKNKDLKRLGVTRIKYSLFWAGGTFFYLPVPVAVLLNTRHWEPDRDATKARCIAVN